MNDETKVNRNYDAVVNDLSEIERSHPDGKVKVMADALRWGWASARTTQMLESHLRQQPDLNAYVEYLAALWDGRSYLSGALRTANIRIIWTFEQAGELGDIYHNEVNDHD